MRKIGKVINDDHEYAKEQKRKRAPKFRPPTTMLNTACCGRCANWDEPLLGDDYGECKVAFVRSAKYAEDRIILSFRELEGRMELTGEMMRPTCAFLACSQYRRG